MTQLYHGMLWLTRPGEKADNGLAEAVEYAEGKYARRPQVILRPEGESYPESWMGIPVRGNQRVQAYHLYLVLERLDEPAAAVSLEPGGAK